MQRACTSLWLTTKIEFRVHSRLRRDSTRPLSRIYIYIYSYTEREISDVREYHLIPEKCQSGLVPTPCNLHTLADRSGFALPLLSHASPLHFVLSFLSSFYYSRVFSDTRRSSYFAFLPKLSRIIKKTETFFGKRPLRTSFRENIFFKRSVIFASNLNEVPRF